MEPYPCGGYEEDRYTIRAESLMAAFQGCIGPPFRALGRPCEPSDAPILGLAPSLGYCRRGYFS